MRTYINSGFLEYFQLSCFETEKKSIETYKSIVLTEKELSPYIITPYIIL